MRLVFIGNNLQREPITAAAAIGMGITAASAGGQIYAQGKMNKKTREWNERMYAIQRRDAIADRDYNSSKEQMKRLKEAGLNPALIYGDSGAGAVTQTRGSAPGNWNPQVAPIGGMGLMAGQQVALLQAQVENIKADTADKLANLPVKGAQTPNIEADTENKKLAGIIADYTGKELKDVYEKISVPNRDMQGRATTDQYSATSAIGQTLNEMFIEGRLKDKSIAEVEQIMIGNAKSRQEIKAISKSMDLLEQNIKGASLENEFKKLDLKLQQETGLGRDAPGWSKLMGRIMQLLMQ